MRARLADLVSRHHSRAEILTAVGDPTVQVVARAAARPAELVVVAAVAMLRGDNVADELGAMALQTQRARR